MPLIENKQTNTQKKFKEERARSKQINLTLVGLVETTLFFGLHCI